MQATSVKHASTSILLMHPLSGASDRGTTDWVSMLSLALTHAFPNANVTVSSWCTPSWLGVYSCC